MRNWFHVRPELPRPDRPAGYDDDVEYSEALVEHFVDLFTEPGDVVLDPFVGFGTTLMVAERMGRRAIGIEMLPERAEYVRVASPTRHPSSPETPASCARWESAPSTSR